MDEDVKDIASVEETIPTELRILVQKKTNMGQILR